MRSLLPTIASILALAIGVMALFAGGKVLVGQDPGYYVIFWLPLYNYTVGLFSVLITAPAIWRNRYGLLLSIVTLALHVAVLVIIQSQYKDVVASESTKAMIVRNVVWLIIIGLQAAAKLLNKKGNAEFLKTTTNS